MAKEDKANKVANKEESGKKSFKISLTKTPLNIFLIIAIPLLLLTSGIAIYGVFGSRNIPVVSDVIEQVEKATGAYDIVDKTALQSDTSLELLSLISDIEDKDQDEIIEELMGLVESETVSMKIDYDIAFDLDDGYTKMAGDVYIDMDGYMDFVADEISDSSGSLDIDFLFKADGTEISGAGELRVVDENLYLQISSFPALFGGDDDIPVGDWFNFDLDEIVDEYSDLIEELDETDVIGSFGYSVSEDGFEEYIKVSEKVMNENTVRVDDEVYDGIRTRCYQTVLDEDALEEMFDASNDIYSFTDSDMEEMMKESHDEAMGMYDTLEYTWCLGRNDNKLYHMEYLIETDIDDIEMEMVIKIDLFDYGVKKSVDKPDDSEDLTDELIPTSDSYGSSLSPAANFAKARDTQRSADVIAILNAITQYTIEEGAIQSIPSCTSGALPIGENGVDLGSVLVDDYLVGIPLDPQYGDEYDSGYEVCTTDSGRIKVSAQYAEGEYAIVVTR